MRLYRLLWIFILAVLPASHVMASLAEGESAFLDNDFKKALIILQPLAEEGNARAQSYLGEYYRDGKGIVAIDLAKATEWFTKSAAQGDCNGLDDMANIYADDFGGHKDEKAEMEWRVKEARVCKVVADKGDVMAQLNLATQYLEGVGVEKNVNKAVALFRKVATKHVGMAGYKIALIYIRGAGVNIDIAQGVEWMRRSAEAGYPDAQAALGRYYEVGFGVEGNILKAVDFYRKAVANGSADAMYFLGEMYFEGRGVKPNVDEAALLFHKSADQGDDRSQMMMGLFSEYGFGGKQDSIQAVEWFRKAVAANNPQAMYLLAAMYLAGRGVEKSQERAYELYQKSAELGLSEAQIAVGKILLMDAPQQDYQKAREWFLKAAEKSSPQAFTYLGIIYYNGFGVEKDVSRAVELFGKASVLGESAAQMVLGTMYFKGKDLTLDPLRAYVYVTLCANSKDEKSKDICGSLRDFYREKLTPDQQKKADQAVSAWHVGSPVVVD